MRKSKLGRVGRRIGALMLSVCLLVCTEGMTVWATGAEVIQDDEGNMINVVEELQPVMPKETAVEVLLQEGEVSDEEAEMVETEVEIPVLTREYSYYKPYDDATYELQYAENGDGVEITGYKGTASGKLVLPEEIEGKVVNSIGGSAFAKCTNFTGDLVIPKYVKNIGSCAFLRCTGLDGSLKLLCESEYTIGESAFFNCSGLKGELIIPEGVASIGMDTFNFCKGLTGDLAIPEGVTSIGSSAFRNTGFDGTLTLPDSLEKIGYSAFEEVGFTGDLTIPENVTQIDDWAFHSCEKFSGTLKILGNIKKWSSLTFYKCGFEKIIIAEGVTKIPNDTFEFCKNVVEVSLPSTLKEVGSYAFYGCESLKKVEIPNGVSSIEYCTFGSCEELEEVILPKSVTRIEKQAFTSCEKLRKVNIHDDVTFIGESAFSGCDISGKLVLPKGLTQISSGAFGYNKKITEIVLPQGITAIGSRAFSNCTSLKKIVIPEGVTEIGSSAFSGCSVLKEINLPAKLKSIGGYAFYGCSALIGTLEIPNGVTTIDEKAFAVCSGFNGKIMIPSSVTSIGKDAFALAKQGGTAIPIIIYGAENSYAQTYAEENGYDFVAKTGAPGYYPLPDDFEQITVTPLGEFSIMLVDELGRFVEGANITVEAASGQETYTFRYEDGFIYIPVTKEQEGKNVKVSAKKTGMLNAENFFELKGGKSGYLQIRKSSVDPSIRSVMITNFNNQYSNISMCNYIVYKTDEYAGKTFTLRTETQGLQPSYYQLMQGDKVIGYSTTNIMTVNPAKDLVLNGAKPEMVTYTEDGKELARKKVLFDIKERPWDEKPIKVSLGQKIKFVIPESNIPFFSGEEFEIDTLKEWPAKIEVEGNKLRLEIGDANILEKGKDPAEKFKNRMFKYDNEYIEASLSAMSKHGVVGNFDVSIEVFGYGEGIINPSDAITPIEVGVYMKISSGEKGYTRYMLIGWLPCYIKVTSEADAKFSANGTLSYMAGKILNPHFNMGMDLSAAIGFGGGVGFNDVACIDGNLKGTLGYQLHASTSTSGENSSRVTLNANGYLRAKLLMFEDKHEYVNKTWELYPELKALSAGNSDFNHKLLKASDFQVMSRDYLLDNGSLPVLKSNGDDTQVIINGLYPDAKPRLVSYKGTDYLFYLDDQQERGAEDRTALVYRKEVNGVFGEPVIVEDDKTGDFDYDVKAAEDGIYVLWQDGNKSLQGITTLEEAAEALILSAAKVTDKGVTLLESPAVTEGLAPISPILVDTGKEIKACWYENSSNDLLQSGQGTSRFYGQALDTNAEKQKVGETVRTITTTDFGMYENALSVAYTVDADNDISTVDDREIYVASKGEVKRLTENEVIDSNAQFGVVSGKQVLVYYSDKNLVCTDGTSTELLLDAEDAYVTGGFISDDFSFTSEGANPAILWKDTYWMGEEAGQGMTMIRFKDGTWGKPTRVAGTTDSLVAYSVLEKNADVVRVVYTASGELDGKEITRLYETEGRERASIGLVRISYEQEDYVPGEDLPFSVTLQNTGALNAEDYEIVITNEAGETIFTQKGSEVIPVGEEKVIALDNFRPADTGDLQTLRIRINGDGRKQDAMNFTLGGADLGLRTEVSYEEDDQILNLQMINGSNMAENMKLTITGAEEEVLYEKEYENVPGKSSVNYLCKLDKFFDMTEADSINLKLESMGRTETYLFDNETTLYRPGSVTKITEVTLEQKEMELTSGETAQLQVSTDGEGTVLYESNNPDSVSETGVVTAKAPGSATITAYTEDGGRAICIITVKEAAPEKPKIELGDVETEWQIRYVKYVCENGYMKGKATDAEGRIIFEPDKPLTREEFIQVLYNAEGKPNVTYKERFDDVPDNKWYTDAIIWGTEKGIVSGYANGKYGVGDPITREQLATMLNKYAQYKGYKVDASAELDSYTDTSKISSWAVDYMKWIVGSNIMSGKGERLDPKGNATRAECATLVNKFHISYGE